jgi:hypothetical protein
MSDERDPGSRPDETRPFSPYGDDEDATRVQPPAGPNHPDGGPRSSDAWVFDRTQQQPSLPDDDATRVTPRPPQSDATSVMPPAQDDWAGGGEQAPWAGRAEVRPPRPGDYQQNDWTTSVPPAEPRGRWWMPILVGIIGLILVALLGWGIWLIIQNQDKNDQTPAPAPVTSAAAPPTTPPSTAPTTEPPTTQPTTTEPTPAEVTIPALRGLSQQDAIQALGRRGLSTRLRYMSSDDAAAGTVIDSDPEEGQQVPPDTVVTLIIAAPPTTAPTAPSGGVVNQPED